MKHFIFSLGLLLIWASLGWAAPTEIGTSVAANSGASASTSLTFSATCPNEGTNRLAIVCVNAQRNLLNDVIASVTWNGTNMTSVGSAGSGSDGGFAQMFRLTNPTCDGAAHNVVITLTTNSHYFTGHVLFLKDVDQTTPVDTPSTAVGATSAVSLNVTSAVNDLVVDCVGVKNSNVNIVAGSGQTQESFDQTTNATASTNSEGGNSTEPGASTVTMSWTHSATPPAWASIGVSVNPASVSSRRRMVPPFRFLHLFDDLMPSYVRAAWSTR